MKSKKKEKRIYVDYASTTPTLLAVRKNMEPYFISHFANPSSLYGEGVDTKNAIKDARKKIATVVGVKSEEVIFTASGTESDNLAILGVGRYFLKNPKILRGKKPHIVTSAIEHPAVLETLKELEVEGIEVTYLPINEDGIVSVEALEKVLRKETILVSIMHVNNEIGTIQPISKIGRIIYNFRQKKKTQYPYFHVDASQSPNYLPVNMAGMLSDLLTLDGSKIYGPKGIGVLCVRQTVKIVPLIFGGGQERGLRSGTENIPGIIGFASALEIVTHDREKESLRIKKITEKLLQEIQKAFPDARLNGSKEKRIPNNINVCFPGMDSEFAVIKMDNLGIACSGASACRNIGEENYSYVIENLNSECKKSSLRFTFGRGSSLSDVDKIITALKKVVKN